MPRHMRCVWKRASGRGKGDGCKCAPCSMSAYVGHDRTQDMLVKDARRLTATVLIMMSSAVKARWECTSSCNCVRLLILLRLAVRHITLDESLAVQRQ